MPKDELGVKRLCPHCASRFYDLQKDPMTCPVCGATMTIESITSAGRTRTMVAEKTSDNDNDLSVDDLSDDDLDGDSSDVDIDDDLLEEDEDDNVSLDEIADVGGEDDDH